MQETLIGDEPEINPSALLAGTQADPNADKPLWRWFVAVILLGVVSLTTGTPNLYPSQRDAITHDLGLSSGLATFMLTGGVMMLFITLPTGMFMDHFGANLTFFISIFLTIIPYIILPFCYKITGLFITLYFVMAFGNASLFIVALQIAMSRSPAKVKGLSTSICSGALSLSFGLFLEIYKAGASGKTLKCIGDNCVISGIEMVMIAVCVMVIVCAPIAYLCYRDFEQGGNQPSVRSWKLLGNYKLYILLLTMFMAVYDGQLIISAGDLVWKRYGRSYPDGASKYGIAFSVTNCVFSIGLSALLDLVMNKTKSPRQRWFGIFWFAMGLVPLMIAILFKTTDNEILFAVFTSMMGIPFGFGMTHIPALTSDTFGNDKVGFAFGVVQIGSIIASASTMSIMNALEKTGTMMAFIVAALLHVICSGLVFFLLKPLGDADVRSPTLNV